VYSRYKADIDLVLLDIGLPKVAGWDVLTRIKEENPHANVLVASGYIEPEFKTRICAAGVNGFIDKPYLPDEVIQTVRSIISGGPDPLLRTDASLVSHNSDRCSHPGETYTDSIKSNHQPSPRIF
jgi:DNA-binding NarL/FixJ family response regulator